MRIIWVCPICHNEWTTDDVKKLKRRGLTIERDIQNHKGYHSLAQDEPINWEILK